MQLKIKELFKRCHGNLTTKIFLIILFLIGILVICYFLNIAEIRGPKKQIIKNNNLVETNNSSVDDFKCPEDYTSRQEYVESVAKYISDLKKKYPDITEQELGNKRNNDIINHGCKQSPQNIDEVTSSASIIEFLNNKFEFYTKEFDNDTKVGSSYYSLAGQDINDTEEEIIFNFYFQGLYSDKVFTAEHIANLILSNKNLNIESKFEAPDNINKKPAYFFLADTVNSGDNFGQIFIIKVAYVGESVYSVIFSKNITAQNGENINNKILKWFEENGEKYGDAIGNINPDEPAMIYMRD